MCVSEERVVGHNIDWHSRADGSVAVSVDSQEHIGYSVGELVGESQGRVEQIESVGVLSDSAVQSG